MRCEKIPDIQLRHRGAALFAPAVISVVASFFVLTVAFESSIDIWFLEDDPNLLTYRDFQKRFEADEIAESGPGRLNNHLRVRIRTWGASRLIKRFGRSSGSLIGCEERGQDSLRLEGASACALAAPGTGAEGWGLRKDPAAAGRSRPAICLDTSLEWIHNIHFRYICTID